MAEHEQSFVVTRDTYQSWKIWFKCYRAKCGARGLVTDDDSRSLTLSVGEAEPGVSPEADPDDFQAVPDALLRDLAEKYDTDHKLLQRQHLRYDPQQHAIVLPVLNQGGSMTSRFGQVGWQHRRLDEKVIRLIWTDSVCKPLKMGCVRTGMQHKQAPTVVLVENLFSAYRIQSITSPKRHSHDMDAVALLGHGLSSRVAAALARTYKHAILLLDPDTWPTGPVDALKALAPYDIKAEARFLSGKPKDVCRVDLLEVLASKV
jgi:hypothetical protein